MFFCIFSEIDESSQSGFNADFMQITQYQALNTRVLLHYTKYKHNTGPCCKKLSNVQEHLGQRAIEAVNK